MTAAKFGDPVLGIDVHMVIIPGPPGTVPLPHPFIGVVFDPLGAALGAALGAVFGGGGPVFVNGMPTGNTGTEVVNIPHFPTPPGTAPAPNDAPPDNEGTLLTGSKTVKFGGSSQSRELSSAISCSFPIDLPSSVVTPVPMGAPVNIGGPEAIDYMVAATSALKSGLKHAKKKWGKGASDWAHKKLGAPAGSKRSKFICFLTGHPVDVATGELIAEATDFELGGSVLPITWQRNYRSREGRHPTLPTLSSTLTERTPALGPAWFHPFETWLEESHDGALVEVAGADGRPKTFHGLRRPGDSDWDPEDRETLTRRPHGYELIKQDGTRWIYREQTPLKQASGARKQKRVLLLQHVVDPSDNRVDLFYERGYLRWIVDAAGRALEVRWNHEARMESMWLLGFVAPPIGSPPHEHAPPTVLSEPLARAQVLVQYRYDDLGQLIAARDAAGHEMTYAWSNGVLVRERHKTGTTFHFAWDFEHPDGNVIRTWGENPSFDATAGAWNALPKLIYDRRIRYVKEQRLTVVEDGRGGITRYYTNGLGLVDKIADPLNITTEYTYSPGSWKLSERDGLGNETRWEYDREGRMTRETNALGLERSWEYDAAGNLAAHRDEARATTTLAHDHRRLVIAITNAVGDLTRLRYDHRGRPEAFVDPMGRVTTLAWNDRNELVQTRVTDRLTVHEYDAHGRRVGTTDPVGRREALERDVVGNVVRSRRLDGELLTMRHDEEGNVVEIIDARGRSTRLRYAAMGHLVEHVDAIGGRVRLRYDTDLELVAVENQHGDTHTFELDRAGRVTTEKTFTGTKHKAIYDRAGRAIQVWSGARRLKKLERDELGRVVKQTSHYPIPGVLADPTTETFEYDLRGALRRATTASTEVRFERDLLGRVVGESETLTPTSLEARISHTYDRSGLRLRRTTSFAHRADYRYDMAGELVAIEAGWDVPAMMRGLRQAEMPNFEIKFARDRLGQELARRLPGGVTSVWMRDEFARPTEQRVLTGASTQAPGRDVAKRVYAWSSPQEIASITTVGSTGLVESGSQYDYDPRGHLVRQLFSSGEVLERQTDAIGNLYKSSARDDRVYGPGGTIRRVGSTKYEVDLDGFITKKVLADGATWKYQWDAHGHLTEVVRPDGRKASYTYDAFGRRTTKNYDGVTTEFVWDGDDLVHERRITDASGERATVTTWVFEPGAFSPVAKIEGRMRFGIVSDHLGSPTMLATEAGEIAWRAQLDVYGVPREESAGVSDPAKTKNPWRFPGQYEDEETGLYYNRFRYYDPELGRYCSEDPIGLRGGVSLYGYVSEPNGWFDPFGLSPWAWDPDNGMGHHLVPRRKAESMGWDHLASERHAPTFFPDPYTPGMHEELHRVQRPHLGPNQGPWLGTGDELLRAARKGLADFTSLGKLMIPATKEVLAEGVTATEAFDVLKKWHKKQLRLKAKLACGS